MHLSVRFSRPRPPVRLRAHLHRVSVSAAGIAFRRGLTLLFDPKVKTHFRWYVFQCLLAAATLGVILSIVDAVDRAVIVAAIASTAFVLFVTPSSPMARTRNVIGGHLVALLVGTAASHLPIDTALHFAVEGSLAVGFALFLMAATDTEHGPAAGTALAVVIGGFSWSLAALLGTSILVLAVAQRLLRPHLHDLY